MIKKILKVLWLIIAVVFMYLPIIVLAVYSFTDTAIIGASGRFSLNNYKVLFTTPELLKMIKDTLILAAGSAAIAMLLGTFGAIGAFYSKKTPRTVVTTFNQIPVVNADVVTGFSICVFLIVVLGISKESYVPLVAGHVVLSTPFVYLSVMPRLKQMDHSLYEAALDLGAGPGQALFKVVIPQLLPGIVSGFFMAFTLSLDDYFITTYTKPATFDTISTYVYNATRGSHTEIKTALWALSTLIFLIILIIVIANNIISARKEGNTDEKVNA
ncbi:spermidine/putrescine ABC transporter permease protein PotC [Eshraghiella crossota CAG:259]|uniref:Spermidine/putrescine ABC transporter permease protein PotC n=1 Tax=Eshraghiella crossota CAG:259 TaxID=1263062 RepID=R5LHG9_9FIRM|nr:spermidine/putrescine ABC transporter permease protein PotC [Butyrivibrio crossotus CAG:259]